MKAHPSFWLTFALLLLALSGCKGPSRDDKISAKDDIGFELWISDHRDLLSPADIKEINTARQQIRYKVMQKQPGLPSSELAAAVYQEIDGRTLQELLRTGYALQIERMKTELLNYQPQLERFQTHKQNPGLDDEQKQTVDAALAKLDRLMREHQQELARLTQRLTELESSGSGLPTAK